MIINTLKIILMLPIFILLFTIGVTFYIISVVGILLSIMFEYLHLWSLNGYQWCEGLLKKVL